VQAYLLLSQIAEKQRDFAQAQSFLERIRSPQDAARVQLRRAMITALAGSLDDALALLDKLPDSDPDEARIKPWEHGHITEDYLTRPSSCGPPAPVASLQIRAEDGVTVNVLAPGSILTDRTTETSTKNAAAKGISVEQVIADAAKEIPAKRFGMPSEYGPMGAFLAGDTGSYVTGSMIRIDGGRVRGMV
jgi:hypothetical protein